MMLVISYAFAMPPGRVDAEDVASIGSEFLIPDWSAPLQVDRSSRGFDRLPGVLILELRRAEIAERGV